MNSQDDPVFQALADASRRELLDRLYRKNGQTLGELCEGLGMTRQAVAKHLAILEMANLVSFRRQGREKLHFINPAPINDIAERWIRKFEQRQLAALSALKIDWKETTVTEGEKSSFVYVIYIRTTPEKLWAALTSPEFAQEYWRGAKPEAEWKTGGSWKLMLPDGRLADSGEIIECEPRKRLAIKWRNEFIPELKAEGYSLCTMEIESAEGDAVKLTVTHRIDRRPSKFIAAASTGWPQILSNLKSLLETGSVLLGAKYLPKSAA